MCELRIDPSSEQGNPEPSGNLILQPDLCWEKKGLVFGRNLTHNLLVSGFTLLLWDTVLAHIQFMS